MRSAKRVPVVKMDQNPHIPEAEMLSFLELLVQMDIQAVNASFSKKSGHMWIPIRDGFKVLADELINPNRKFGIPNLPEENVPLYCFRSTQKRLVNGRASQIVGAVNSLSWAVLKGNKSTVITDQIKIPSIIPLKTYIGFATTVTTFGIVKMTRVTIPIHPEGTNQEKLNSELF